MCASIDAVGGYAVSVSIWEIGVKIQKGKLDLGMTLFKYVELVNQVNIVQVPVDTSLWVDSLALKWDHRDPADRLIVAFAKRKNLPIVSSDGMIKEHYPSVIW
jgi:PIN domain nuclease of toxin-antitoxin system